MSQDQDKDTRFALFLVFALIAAIVIGVLWFGASTVLKNNRATVAEVPAPVLVLEQPADSAAADAAAAAAATVTGAAVSSDTATAAPAADVPAVPPAVQADLSEPFVAFMGQTATFYFVEGEHSVPADDVAAERLRELVNRLQQGADGHVRAFNGEQPGSAADRTLVERRAQEVQALLLRLGVPAERLEVLAIETETDNTSRRFAQRVELVVPGAGGPVGAVPRIRTGGAAPAASNTAAAAAAPVVAADERVQPSGSGAAAPAGAIPRIRTGAAPASSNATATADEGPRVVVENGVVKFYFGVGSDALASGASDALLDIITAVNSGKRAVVSGYTDPTGDAALNEELAKRRAVAVRDTLTGLGVPADRIELERPRSHTGSGSNAEARRVEVHLED